MHSMSQQMGLLYEGCWFELALSSSKAEFELGNSAPRM